MRIVFISDTHTQHSEIDLPDGDILVHCGDATYRGNIGEVTEFRDWFNKQPHKHKIFIPGNHDWIFQTVPESAMGIMGKVTTLIDESVIIDGIKFYGSPWQPEFCDWAFNLPRGEALAKKWALIPDDTQVLITHGPPFSFLDRVPPKGALGCEDLAKRVLQLRPTIHAFGHIHEGYGVKQNQDTLFVNASTCTGAYVPSNKPIWVDVLIVDGKLEVFDYDQD